MPRPLDNVDIYLDKQIKLAIYILIELCPSKERMEADPVIRYIQSCPILVIHWAQGKLECWYFVFVVLSI